ncbi:MAG: hypothetical protein WAW07_08165 [Bacteroidales bacterium]
MGSPYHNPHVSRPYDTPVPGSKVPGEHPLEGVIRMINGTALFRERFPAIAMVGSGWSYLRHFAPCVAAAVIGNGRATFAGFGRNSFAYPSMPLDLMNTGKADPKKTCITCSGCTRLIRSLRPGGCVIRDRQKVAEAAAEASALYKSVRSRLGASSAGELAACFRISDLCLTHYLYLEAVRHYIEGGGRSRRSYIVTEGVDSSFNGLAGNYYGTELCRYNREVEASIQEARFVNGKVRFTFTAVREIPEQNLWFEKVWKEYLKDNYPGEQDNSTNY